MFDNKIFWRAQHLVALVFWGYAISQVALGNDGWVVKIAAGLLLIHILEIPVALKVLAPRKPSTGLVAVNTILFGYTWWLPARRGLFPVGGG